MNTTEIHIGKIGQVFSSRPEGREAALSIIAYQFNQKPVETVILNFDQVLIMTPSWLSEFIQTIRQHGVRNVQYKNDSNKSVASSIEMIEIEDQAQAKP